MSFTSSFFPNPLQLFWVLTILLISLALHAVDAKSLHDYQDDFVAGNTPGFPHELDEEVAITQSKLNEIQKDGLEKRRLRFVRRSSSSLPSSEYILEEPSYERDSRAPRLRYYKKDVEDSGHVRDARAPRLRYYKRDSIDPSSYERDARAPRLRFIKRESKEESSFDRDARAPRLRFIKRSAVQQNRQPSPESSDLSSSHSRTRRSIFSSSPGLSKRRLSFNNDIRAIADMIHFEENRRRIEAENELRRKLLEIGKRSPASGSEFNGDVVSSSVTSKEEKGHVVQALADTLVDYALAS